MFDLRAAMEMPEVRRADFDQEAAFNSMPLVSATAA